MTSAEPLGAVGNDERRRIADAIEAVILSASINGRSTVSLTLRVTGEFERPGSRAALEPTVIVVTVPAKVLPM